MFLSGAGAAVSILKEIGKATDFPGMGGGGGKAGSKVPKGGGGIPGAAPVVGAGTFFSALTWQYLVARFAQSLGDTPGETFDDQLKYQQDSKDKLARLLGLSNAPRETDPQSTAISSRVAAHEAMDNATRSRAAGFGGTTDTLPGKTADDLGIGAGRIDASSLAEIMKPRGTQDVRVVNNQPVNAPVYATFNITGVSDPKAAADAALAKLGDLVKSDKESSFSD